MDIKQLHCFTLVARYLNFSDAAKHLAVNQSTVSYQIAELERQLDMKLFHRDKQGVSLTASGTIFAQEVGRILEDLNEAINKAWMAKSGAAGTLAIGFLSSMERVLGDVVKRFPLTHPNISLSLTQPSMQGLNDGLRDGSLDVGVTFSFGLEPFEGLRQLRLCGENVAVVMPPDHPLATREHLCIADLRDVPMVTMSAPDSGSTGATWILERFLKRGFSPNVVRRTSSFETMLFLIESGLGVGFLTRQSALYYSNFKLLARDLEDEDLAVDLVLTWRGDNANPSLPLLLREFGIVP
ncbi:LysR family transcriptional regulator [Holophaga foetida]|uniref:LysR family transcriptional regulator n=1 Tax=Holophaga foetida TaxID=35839 RepID=UPI0002E33295|nr:LysR family transcriptional regulator [Holophaga foetida]